MDREAEISFLKSIIKDAHEAMVAVEWSGLYILQSGRIVHGCPFCRATQDSGTHTEDCRLSIAIERTRNV